MTCNLGLSHFGPNSLHYTGSAATRQRAPADPSPGNRSVLPYIDFQLSADTLKVGSEKLINVT